MHRFLQPLHRHRSLSGRSAAAWLLVLLLALCLLTIYYSTQRNAMQRLRSVSDFNMTRLNSLLDSALQRHEYLPELLSRNPRIQAFLQTPPNTEQRAAMGLYLKELNRIAHTLDIYLLNPDGVTLASSNFEKSYSFVGKNFAFRPYFQQALHQDNGRYFALGTNSGERGYYFATAIRAHEQGDVLGVITVKASVGQWEAEWDSEEAEFMVTDPDGVIFMTSQPGWRLQTLYPLSEDQRRAIQASRRYLREPLPALPGFHLERLDADFSIATLDGQAYLFSSSDPSHGWRTHLLVSLQPVQRTVWLTLGIATLLLGLSSLLALQLWKNQQQRRRYEQRTLEELETKVEERTRQLRRTQEELVQAAKMAALGQLSAAINHELNIPLSAIRAYADNAHQFLQQGRTDMTAANLQEISALTERMAAITRQLKTFSRKSHGQIEYCDLNQALDAALLIIRPKLSRTTVQLHQQRAADPTGVMADRVWLEQILVNLLSNALEAVAEQEDAQLWLHTRWQAPEHGHELDGSSTVPSVCMTVADNGSGISDADLPHIFEAFFTTKTIGKGLGLGLSISYRLARDMHGRLSVANRAGGGAEFTLILPGAHRPEPQPKVPDDEQTASG
ncbi:MAG: ATP-binding protein [Thiolinea sp.]